MGFGDRSKLAEAVIETLDKEFWTKPPMSERVVLAPYGYETRTSEEVRAYLRHVYTNTVKHVRFTPDFLLIDKENAEQTCLFEYKVTQTPLFSSKRIKEIQAQSRTLDSEPTLTWENIGQMEADAYDNYIALQQKLGLQVAVLTYSAYHRRSLLCDFIEKFEILRHDTVQGAVTPTASRTPFVNFDYRKLRSLYYFVQNVFKVTLNPQEHKKLIEGLCKRFPVTHHPSSPQHPNNQAKTNKK